MYSQLSQQYQLKFQLSTEKVHEPHADSKTINCTCSLLLSSRAFKQEALPSQQFLPPYGRVNVW